jgi:hypothetical protein
MARIVPGHDDPFELLRDVARCDGGAAAPEWQRFAESRTLDRGLQGSDRVRN